MEIKVNVKGLSQEADEVMREVEPAKESYLNALKKLHNIISHDDVLSISTKE